MKNLLANRLERRTVMNMLVNLGLILALILPGLNLQAEEHAAGHEEAEGEPGVVELQENIESLFKIKVEKIQYHDVAKELTAPGEVVLNAYKTAIVALRIDGQVVRRLSKMGDKVKKGQPLAEISSIQMSEAQQAFIVNVKEWSRVKQLGRKVVSGKRYIEAHSKWQSSKARLMALGLDENQLKQLEKTQLPDGLFQAISPIDGVVISDDFIEGQFIEAGGQLFVISDESQIWVEAYVSPLQAALFSVGDRAEVEHDGERHQGQIVQVSHLISETTRTQKIRIAIDNSKDDLHPGQFVSVKLQQTTTEKKLTVPENALVRTADGDWAVFVEEKPKRFKQVEVELERRQGDSMIINGIKDGTPVVIEGAFYLSSELAKAGFDSDDH